MAKLKKIFLNLATICSVLFLINFNSACSFALEIPTEMILDGGFDILPDGNGNFFITSYDKNSAKSALAYIDNISETPTIKKLSFFNNGSKTENLDYKYTTANYYNDCLYLTNATGTNISPYKIRLSQNLLALTSEISLPDAKIASPKQIALGNNGNLFILGSSKANSVAVYSATEELINSNGLSQSGKTFHTVATDISKNYLYALDNSNNMLRYNINSDKYTFESPEAEINISNFKFLTDNIFVTSDRHICILNNSAFKLDSKIQIATEIKNYPTCVTSGFDVSSILAKTDDKIISRVRCSDGAITGKIELNENILALSTSREKIIAVTGDSLPKNITLIDEKSITEIVPPEPETPGGSEGNQGSDHNDTENKDNENSGESGDDNKGDENNGESDGNNSENDKTEENPSDETDEDAITSDIHHINLENHIISEIPAGTTFAEFKNNLTFNGYSLIFKDSKGNVKTGNSTKIGTGYTVTFVKDGTEKTLFKLIVQGDLTGTGTLTSRDILAFVNYLLGKANLDDASLQAANINEDDEANTIDLFLMYKMLQK